MSQKNCWDVYVSINIIEKTKKINKNNTKMFLLKMIQIILNTFYGLKTIWVGVKK